MTPEQKQWVFLTASQAYNAGHIFPTMAACEAALESAYGTSLLAREGHNLFGLKQRQHPTFGSLSLPTREFLDDVWTTVVSNFVNYPNFAACFQDRMATLMRLRTSYEHYNNALMSSTAEQYVREVSKTWSTDPDRAQDCIDIYYEVFPRAVTNAQQVSEAAVGEN